jgi:hypothetical protein
MQMSRNLGKNSKRLLLNLLAFTFLVSSTLTAAPSFAADSSPRIPRAIETIPRPSELTLGLSQIQYQGYFSRNARWFSDAQYVATGIRNSNTLPSGITGIKSSTTTSPTSYSFTGYFIPDSTGEWQFQLTADDAALIWLGNDAVINYASRLATPFLEAYWPDKLTNENKISLTKNSIYPLRIQYGNSGGPSDLKLSYKSPGKNKWEENFSTLLWRSPELTGDCTNFGLSYTLSAELGYDKSIPEPCTRDGSDKYVRSWIKLKPEIPSLISTKLSASGLVLEVNLGDIEVSKTYLIAPSIGYLASSNLVGKIRGKVATFVIPISKLNNISKVELNLVSSNSQGITQSQKKSLPIALSSNRPIPSIKPTPKKTVPAPKTVRCDKGDKTRVFAGTTCPPGWSK